MLADMLADFQRLIPRMLEPPPKPIENDFVHQYVYKPKSHKVQTIQFKRMC